jgi:L-cysteine desulfidase
MADFAQNVSLALILSGHIAQPWPRISAICAPVTLALEGTALAFAFIGWLATRQAASTAGVRLDR